MKRIEAVSLSLDRSHPLAEENLKYDKRKIKLSQFIDFYLRGEDSKTGVIILYLDIFKYTRKLITLEFEDCLDYAQLPLERFYFEAKDVVDAFLQGKLKESVVPTVVGLAAEPARLEIKIDEDNQLLFEITVGRYLSQVNTHYDKKMEKCLIIKGNH